MSDTSRGPGSRRARDGASSPSGPVPPPPPPSTGKKSLARRPVSWVVLAVAAVAIVLAVVLVGHASNDEPVSSADRAAATATGNGGSAPSTASSTVPTTPTAAASRTLLSQRGSGFASLPPFAVPTSAKGWLVHYLFNCAPSGSSGNFAIYVDDATGLTTSVAANELAIHGGSTYYSYTHGTYSLQINSQCNWAAVVQTIPQ